MTISSKISRCLKNNADINRRHLSKITAGLTVLLNLKEERISFSVCHAFVTEKILQILINERNLEMITS